MKMHRVLNMEKWELSETVCPSSYNKFDVWDGTQDTFYYYLYQTTLHKTLSLCLKELDYEYPFSYV